MASPLPVATMGGGSSWNGQSAQFPLLQQSQTQRQPPLVQTEAPETGGLQSRIMGLKVHYTFDTEAKVNCLARYPQALPISTFALDDSNAIGIIDLRLCVQAIMDCSPELGVHESDFTIYAVDFSEPDTPLVGQGLLSWTLNSMRNESTMQQSKMVTGRVTRNLMGVFTGSNRETLEVRLRLTATARRGRLINVGGSELQQHDGPMEGTFTPTAIAEWNSLMQSNTRIAQDRMQAGDALRVASPATTQGQGPASFHCSAATSRRDSFDPASQQQQQQQPQQQQPQQQPAPGMQIAPNIACPPTEQRAEGVAPSSRPSSRASTRAPRRKATSSRPRGRPRKKQGEGNTSGCEEVTESEDGPAKKRAKTVVADRASPNPFSTGPESLRVAASTSGSLRNFRPILANTTQFSGNSSHQQEGPRAPTPIPGGSPRRLPARMPGQASLRRGSTLGLGQHSLSNASSSAESRPPLSPSQEDGRSPESLAPTPAFSEDSPADIGSSPPVQRAAAFIRSSPLPSSPVLPPMPPNELPRGTSFATDDLEDLFGEQPTPTAATPLLGPGPRKPAEARNGIPIQVFQMQNGPSGQDMVHICSYNTPPPNSTSAPGPRENQPLPPLRKASTRMSGAKDRSLSPRVMAPTPPATTDAMEKPASPLLTAESAMNDTKDSTPAAASSQTADPAASTEPSKPHDAHKDAQGDGLRLQETRPAPAGMKASRPLCRSQSAGPLALPIVPASEPAGPSSLSQSMDIDSNCSRPPFATKMKRAASTGPLTLPIPASDPTVPIAPPTTTALPDPTAPAKGDVVAAPSSPRNRSNKNIVKKHAIKQRLEEAIMNGEMPPYCSNCGAIETPTWRKIWTQDNDGVPEYCEYSVEAGKITAIDILQRDVDGRPSLHRLIKKSLGPEDDRTKWKELLLCNPCGIWLAKCKSHRPQDRWDKDASRLGQERRKRGSGRGTSRPKKSRSGGDGLINLTSEANVPTDALGPTQPSSPRQQDDASSKRGGTEENEARGHSAGPELQETQSNPGSSHSRASDGSNTEKIRMDIEFDEAVGNTRRLLFPSPRREGVLKTLNELEINMVQTVDDCQPKAHVSGKENMATMSLAGADYADHDDLHALLRYTAGARPSTPPPNGRHGASKEPFKTPTRPTPTHRPVTRSLSRSIRSIRSMRSVMASPDKQGLSQRTPSKTPRVAFGPGGSANRRRSPRNHQGSFEAFDSPISRALNQFFSNGTEYGDEDLDMSNLRGLDGHHDAALLDFGHLLSTDAMMPSSPPKDGSISYDFPETASVWAQWDVDGNGDMDIS